jgi:hypothetical protein
MYTENTTNDTAAKPKAEVNRAAYYITCGLAFAGAVILSGLAQRLYEAKRAEAFDAGFFVGQHWK